MLGHVSDNELTKLIPLTQDLSPGCLGLVELDVLEWCMYIVLVRAPACTFAPICMSNCSRALAARPIPVPPPPPPPPAPPNSALLL